jgi:superfamily I DNA and RNA helicase
VCFNRPLADHLSKLVPPLAEVTTFHQLCRDHADRKGETLDFSDSDIFTRITKNYLEDSEKIHKSLDLLIIDESQDFVPEWAIAVTQRLKETGTLYVMGDAGQQIYDREQFDLTDAVHVKCMDNFRSPSKVVHVINQLQLSDELIVSRSAHSGETPQNYTWGPNSVSSLIAINQCLKRLWEEGYKPEQVAVISFKGVKNSEAMAQAELGGYKTKRFSNYDDAGNTLWTDGALLIESVYRFKGQSMPVVVLCEVDFDELTERDKRKLFVGLTRAQIRVDLVISEKSAQLLLKN